MEILFALVGLILAALVGAAIWCGRRLGWLETRRPPDAATLKPTRRAANTREAETFFAPVRRPAAARVGPARELSPAEHGLLVAVGGGTVAGARCFVTGMPAGACRCGAGHGGVRGRNS